MPQSGPSVLCVELCPQPYQKWTFNIEAKHLLAQTVPLLDIDILIMLHLAHLVSPEIRRVVETQETLAQMKVTTACGD